MKVGKLVGAKGEEFVLDDRASNVAARPVVVIGRFSGKQSVIDRGPGKVVNRVVIAILIVQVGRSMPVVRARLGDKGELTTSGMPVFGAELVGREVELLNRVGNHRGVRPRYTEIVVIDAVHGKVIFAGTG